MKNSSGFTLIELLVVIAIIGILASIALPYYKGYVIRAKLVEVENTMANVATAVSSYHQDNQDSWPDCPTSADIETSLGLGFSSVTRVSNISVSTDGIITATVQNIDPLVDSKSLTLTPNPNDDGSFDWTWGASSDFPIHLRVKRSY